MYLATLRQCVSVTDWQEICAKAVRDAKRGDHRARQWLSDHLLDRGLADRIEALEIALKLRKRDR